jgi:hypothetical protein
MQSHSRLCMTQMAECYWSEGSSPSVVGHHWRYSTRNSDREHCSGQANMFIVQYQYLNNMSHGQNLSSTSGEPEFVAQ